MKIAKWDDNHIKNGVRNGSISAYIKPTKYVHDSGYRCFEIGYCSTRDKNVSEKMVLDYGDVVQFHNLLDENIKFCIKMDLTKNGYVRMLGKCVWGFVGIAATLEIIKED